MIPAARARASRRRTPVLYNSVAAGSNVVGNSSNANSSWTHTMAAGDKNGVFVVLENSSVTTTAIGFLNRSVTYGGVAMTSLGSVSGAGPWMELFFLADVPVGASTIAVTVTPNGGSTNNQAIRSNSVGYSGIGSVGAIVTNGATSNAASVVVPSTGDRDRVVGFVGSRTNNINSAGQTERFRTNTAPRMLIEDTVGVSADVSMTAALAASVAWSAIGVNIAA